MLSAFQDRADSLRQRGIAHFFELLIEVFLLELFYLRSKMLANHQFIPYFDPVIPDNKMLIKRIRQETVSAVTNI